jgi:hypothetical protein
MPSITPAGQEVEILDYLFQVHGTENVLLILGAVVSIDHRLEYALLHGIPDMRPYAADNKVPENIYKRNNLYKIGVRRLAVMVAQCRSSHDIFIFLLKAFPDAMTHFNIQISQDRGGGLIGSSGDNTSVLPKQPDRPVLGHVPDRLSAGFNPESKTKEKKESP